jgi:hypothetical protein
MGDRGVAFGRLPASGGCSRAFPLPAADCGEGGRLVQAALMVLPGQAVNR